MAAGLLPVTGQSSKPQPVCRCRFGQLARQSRGDGAVVDQRGAGADVLQDAAFALVQLAHDIVVAQHRDDNIGFADRLRRRCRSLGSELRQLLRLGGGAVPDCYLEAFL